ncbi:MAG: TldD/PmbA family protein [SAR324 cluster bacterium]|nr:TldD/PmbA family protein [SAR324 cluster bacterium]
MDSQQAIDYVLALARENHLRDVDLLLGREESMTVRVLNGRVEKVDQSTDLGLGIRVVSEGRTGLAYTERLEQTAIEKAVLAARENALLLDPTEVVLNTEIPDVPAPGTLNLFEPELESLAFDDLAAFALEMESTAKKSDKRVTAVPYASVGKSRGSYRVVSTRGMDYTQEQNSVGAYCGALLEENGLRKTGSHHWSARVWDPGQSGKLGRKAVELGAAVLGAEKIAGAAMPIVLDEYCAPQLLGMYLGAFYAEAAQKGQSRLKGRLGEQIAKPELTLTDDPHRKGAQGSRYLDPEGTPTQPLNLIEEGRFTNFLYHVESARKEGRASTGHAGRGFSGGISTRTHNVVLATGAHSLDELCAIPERCLLVTDLEGAAGCNPLSGDISIGVQGFLVEGGKRVHPVDSVTIAGNFFELLKQIEARGNIYQPNLTSTFIPALLVEGLVVSS